MYATVVVLLAALSFWLPALRAVGHRVWPVPLDDVYIHYDFARSWAYGRPSTWIVGNGYSSGGTSLLYPLVLAPGWIVGFRGSWLGIWAALIAVASLIDLARSLRAMVGPRSPMALALPWLLIAVPVLDWNWFSGMETALLGAALGRALLAVRRAEASPPGARSRAAWAAGGWLTLLPAVRPETTPLALALSVAVAHASGPRSPLPILARAALPTIALVVAQAWLNLVLTGEMTAAGAVRKLVLTDPYRAPVDRAIDVLRNLVRLRTEAFEIALGGAPWCYAPFALLLAAIVHRRTRRLGVALSVGLVASLLLVSLNTTAPFQNLRYAAPALAMLLLGAWLGADAMARRGRAFAAVAALLVAATLVGPSGAWSRQRDHFARASRNIAEQQVEVGRRLGAMDPPPRRVFVGDAGAIPYISGLPALDGLGLGGFRGLPFARASVHGTPAVIELIERLEPKDRPDVLAVYDSWWGDLVPAFGNRVFGVRIEDNVICGADEKVVYDADWSALGPPASATLPNEVFDQLDVADLVDERAHQLQLPGPGSGWVVGSTLQDEGERRFDAGRIVSRGRTLRYVVPEMHWDGEALSIAIRSDGAATVRITSSRPDREGVVTPRPSVELRLLAGQGGKWGEASAALPVTRALDHVEIEAVDGDARIFRIRLMR